MAYLEALSMDQLRDTIPPDRITTEQADLEAHSYDWWPVAAKWRQQGKRPYGPQAVIRPQSVAEISRVLQWASDQGIPVTPWGAGSAVTGAPLATTGGISLDLSGLDRILALDETSLLVKVQAGKLGHHLEEELNGRGYTLNHSPQSLNRSTVGGWVATRATGQFSSRWGGIEELVVALTVVLPSGEVLETVFTPRAAVGPDISQLFIGAEGTLGVVAEVTLKIFPLAETRLFETLRFPSIASGLQAMRKIMRCGLRPFLLRFYDEDEARFAVRDATFEGCAMFLGSEGLEGPAHAEQSACLAICLNEGAELLGAAATMGWMERRFDFSTVENLLAEPGGVAETIEVAHFWDGIEPTYDALREALLPLADHVLGHFSHAYPQGTSLYVILLGQVEDAAAAEARLAEIWRTAMEVALREGAAISHHHGVGLARLPYIRRNLGSSMVVLERVKDALDPAGIMCPGKLGLLDWHGHRSGTRTNTD